MRIFLTGATGYVGGAVLDALIRGGHDVTALVRDNEKARRVAARGGHPAIGNLADIESYRGAADAQDGYIHTAFDYVSGRGPAVERAALEMMISSATRPRTAGPRATETRFVIYTSGMWILGRTPEPAFEDAPVNPIALASFRPEHERLVLDAAGPRLRTAVVRPGVVYGAGAGMVGDIFKAAANGLVRVVGDGNNHWPAVYDRDLADLYARWRRGPMPPVFSTPTTKATSASTTSSRPLRGICRCGRTYGTFQSRKHGRRWAGTPTRSRSIRLFAAAVPEPSAGRRRFIRLPATRRGCCTSGAAREKK